MRTLKIKQEGYVIKGRYTKEEKFVENNSELTTLVTEGVVEGEPRRRRYKLENVKYIVDIDG